MSDARSRSACSSSALIIRITGACAAAVEQVLGRRQVLHQPGEIGLAREIVGSTARRRAAVALYARGELRREALGVDRRAASSGRCSTRFNFGDAVDRGVGPRQHDDRAVLLGERQHAVRPGERVGNPRRGRGGAPRGDGIGRHGGPGRQSGAASARRFCRRLRGRRRRGRRRRGDGGSGIGITVIGLGSGATSGAVDGAAAAAAAAGGVVSFQNRRGGGSIRCCSPSR